MFNEASRQPVLIPLDITVELPCSTGSGTQALSKFDKLKSEFNRVRLHHHLQVIKKPPGNEVAIFFISLH